MPPARPERLLRVLDFGSRLVPFAQGLELQDALFKARHAGAERDTLILLQHSPVYTIGKRGKEADFRVPLQDVRAAGVDICHVPRGGEVTYHGPGQLVAYPVVSLKAAGLGARAFVEGLEDSVLATIGAFGVRGRGRLKGATGVWVGDRKIAAIGVKISHGISSHGLALNVTTDLEPFKLIVPCGIADKAVTSLAVELRRNAGLRAEVEGGQERGDGCQREASPSQARLETDEGIAGDSGAVGSATSEQEEVGSTGVQPGKGCVEGGQVERSRLSMYSKQQIEQLRDEELYDAAKQRFVQAFRGVLGYEGVDVVGA